MTALSHILGDIVCILASGCGSGWQHHRFWLWILWAPSSDGIRYKCNHLNSVGENRNCWAQLLRKGGAAYQGATFSVTSTVTPLRAVNRNMWRCQRWSSALGSPTSRQPSVLVSPLTPTSLSQMVFRFCLQSSKHFSSSSFSSYKLIWRGLAQTHPKGFRIKSWGRWSRPKQVPFC